MCDRRSFYCLLSKRKKDLCDAEEIENIFLLPTDFHQINSQRTEIGVAPPLPPTTTGRTAVLTTKSLRSRSQNYSLPEVSDACSRPSPIAQNQLNLFHTFAEPRSLFQSVRGGGEDGVLGRKRWVRYGHVRS